ncbi:MAG: ComF family protein [Chloroflexota bacterium]
MTDQNGLPAPASSPRPPAFKLLAQQLVNTALDFFYPPQCISCGRRVGSLLCPDCQAKIPTVLPAHESNSPLTERRATAEFDGAIQKAIHQLKYTGQRSYAKALSQRLATELARSGWQPDLITAAPLHAARLHERGYNQSDLLAEYLSLSSHIPFRPDAVQRLRDTRPQVGLGFQDRQLNVANAFRAEPGVVKDRKLVIIDDVYTTGATLRACATALLEAGAKQVWALTVASAKSSQPLPSTTPEP